MDTKTDTASDAQPSPELLAEANKFYDEATDKPLALMKYPFLLQTRPEYAHQRK